MDKNLKKLLKESKYFDTAEHNQNIFIPKFMGLIVNDVVLFGVNWIFVPEDELIFMNEKNKDHPIASVMVDTLNSLKILTDEGIKDCLI